MRVHGLVMVLTAVGLIMAPEPKDSKKKDDGRPYLGITVQRDATGAVIQSLDPNGPGAKAGLKAGDVIMKIGGKAIKTARDVVSEVIRSKAGDEITIHVRRGGKEMPVKVKLGKAPSR
jgi:S1-C subfamily serine protease